MPITSATLVVKDVYNGGKSYTFEVSADVDRTDQNTNTAATQPPLSARLRSRTSTPTGLGRRDVLPPRGAWPGHRREARGRALPTPRRLMPSTSTHPHAALSAEPALDHADR